MFVQSLSKAAFGALALVIISFQANGQAYSSVDEAGTFDWSQSAGWTGTTPSYALTLNQSVIINGTTQSSKSITFTNADLIVSAGDTLFLSNANLSFSTSSGNRDLVVEAGGFLIIDGDFTIARSGGNLTVNNEGVVAVSGTAALNTNGGINFSSTGTTYLFNNAQVNGTAYPTGSTVFGTTYNYNNESDFLSAHPQLYSAMTGGGGMVLPVVLTKYTATAEHNGIELSWATASEENFSHFILEHSTNGTHFIKLAILDAAGQNNGGAVYTYTHQQAVAGTNYYRLTAVDLDGTSQDHGVARAYRLIDGLIRIKNNPLINGELNINTLGLGDNTIIKVIDMQGRVIVYTPLTKIHKLNYKPGIYMLTIEDGFYSEQNRIVVK